MGGLFIMTRSRTWWNTDATAATLHAGKSPIIADVSRISCPVYKTPLEITLYSRLGSRPTEERAYCDTPSSLRITLTLNTRKKLPVAVLYSMHEKSIAADTSS